MKPKQKAKDLVDKFHRSMPEPDWEQAKKSALICSMEIREGIGNMGHGEVWSLKALDKKNEFWFKVESEIEKL